MANVDVSIKNIPLSYLKLQNQSFFGSEDYTAAIEVFNQYKRSTEQPESGSSLDEVILPIELLREVLVAKYTDMVYMTKTDTEADDLIFIKFSGKTVNSDEYTARRNITRCSLDITEVGGFLARSVMSNTLIRAAVKAKTNLPVSSVSTDTLAAILKPENTNDPVYDVAKKSIFYGTTLHPDIYDDKAYADSIYKRIAANVTLNITATPLNRLKNTLYNEYKTRDIEGKQACERMVERLVYKYYNRSRIEDKLNWGIEAYNNSQFNEKTLKNIEVTLASLSKDLRLSIYKETSLTPKNSYTIKHSKGATSFRVVVYSLLGTDITDRVQSSTVIDKDNIEITFANPTACTILLLFDVFQHSSINTTNFNVYEKTHGLNVFNQFVINTLNSKATIFLDNYNIDFAFIELTQFEDQLPVKPNRIQFFSDRVEFDFERDYTNLQVYILPTYEVMMGTNNLRVTPLTIKTFLKTYDVFSENVTIWRA